jgi:glycosyltransferase involved in cell wall biosynthesis
VALGHEVYIFAPAPSESSSEEDDPRIIRFPSVPAPVEADYPLAVPYSQAAVRALRKMEFDVIHTQHPVWVGVWGQWYARWTGTPLVTTVHTQYEIYSKLIPLPDVVVEAFLRVRVVSYCNKCHIVTTPAESARRRLMEQGVTTPIEVVYNPTDLSAYERADKAKVREMMGCQEGDVLLGYVGRLAEEKRLPVLLKAAEQVLREYPTARLMIVGDGPARERLEALAGDLGLGERIRFVGAVPHDRVPEYHAAIDLFLSASLTEVQPLSFAEAMAAGTPLVVMDAPGANDMVKDGHNGRLVPPGGGAEALAEAARAFLRDREELRRMGNQAREWARRYSRPEVVRRMLEAYEKARERAAQTD